jgi:GT2 family glycosyltransferase
MTSRAFNTADGRVEQAHEIAMDDDRVPTESVSVVVTTYRRPASLVACLEGLRAQARRPDDVVVVVHESDPDSARRVEQCAHAWPALRSVSVKLRGGVAAYNRGLAAATGSIVAFVDDDAVPAADWLTRLVATYERDARIAGAGGRDLISEDGHIVDRDEAAFLARRSPAVGRIQWFGRQIGNHHVGTGAARDVDVLKGVNMSFRRELVAGHGFDARLRGAGAQMHLELSICLPLRARGLRLVYDPAIVVHHHPAPRAAGEERADTRFEAIRDTSHNEALQILDHASTARRIAFAIWAVAVGTTYAPGLAILGRQLLTGLPGAWIRFVAAQAGRVAAWGTLGVARLPVTEGSTQEEAADVLVR